MATLLIKGMGDGLYQVLRSRAKRNHRSLSQEVITLVQEAINQTADMNQKSTEEFLSLAGSWQDNRSAEEIVQDIRKSRRSGKRFVNTDHVFD